MVREALSGYWSLVDGLTGGAAERARRRVTGLVLGTSRDDGLTDLRARVRDLEREIAALRAATDALTPEPSARAAREAAAARRAQDVRDAREAAAHRGQDAREAAARRSSGPRTPMPHPRPAAPTRNSP
jgi:hypothetical protein